MIKIQIALLDLILAVGTAGAALGAALGQEIMRIALHVQTVLLADAEFPGLLTKYGMTDGGVVCSSGVLSTAQETLEVKVNYHGTRY